MKTLLTKLNFLNNEIEQAEQKLLSLRENLAEEQEKLLLESFPELLKAQHLMNLWFRQHITDDTETAVKYIEEFKEYLNSLPTEMQEDIKFLLYTYDSSYEKLSLIERVILYYSQKKE